MKNHVFKKMIATVLAAATVITAVPLSAVTANAASSDLVSVKSVKQSDAALKKMAYFYGGDAGDYKTTCKKTGKDQYTVTTTNQDFRFYTGKDDCMYEGKLNLTFDTSKMKQKVKKTKNYIYKTGYRIEVYNTQNGSLPVDEINCGKKKTVSCKLEFDEFTKPMKTEGEGRFHSCSDADTSYDHYESTLNNYIPRKYKGDTLTVKIYKITDKIPKGYKWVAESEGDTKPVKTIKIKFNVKNPEMIAEQEYQRCLDWLKAQSYDSEYGEEQKVVWINSMVKTWFYDGRYRNYEDVINQNSRTPDGNYTKIWHGGNCAEFADLFTAMMQDMGIWTQLIYDRGENHAYTIIKVKGQKYYFDPSDQSATSGLHRTISSIYENKSISKVFIESTHAEKYRKNNRNIFTGEEWGYDPEIEEYVYLDGTSNLTPLPDFRLKVGFTYDDYNDYFEG